MEAERQYRWCGIQRDNLQHNGNSEGESPEFVPLSGSCPGGSEKPLGWHGLQLYGRAASLVRSVAGELPEQIKNNQYVNQTAENGGQKMSQYSWFTVYSYTEGYMINTFI